MSKILAHHVFIISKQFVLCMHILIDSFLLPHVENLQNISTNWKTVQAAANSQVQLKCTASYLAFTEADTLWMFEGVILNETDSRYKTNRNKLNSSDITRTEQMSLWISNVFDSHFGNYSCAVNTSLGMSSETILLVQMTTEKGT